MQGGTAKRERKVQIDPAHGWTDDGYESMNREMDRERMMMMMMMTADRKKRWRR